MFHILVDLLPTALGFVGFFVYRRYVAQTAPAGKLEAKEGSPAEAGYVGDDSEPAAEESPSKTGTLVEEPEPSPEPDFSDESPVKSDKVSLPSGTASEDFTDPVKPKSSGLGARSISLILAYCVVTAAVFVHFCLEPVDEEATPSSTAAQDETDRLEEIRLKEQRAGFELPYWTESEMENQTVLPNEDQILRLNLNRQFMTLRGEDGQVIYYKSAYWGYLAIGTPAEYFKVVFDTGSGHLILPSTYCKSETCKAHKRYKRSASFTANDIDHDGTIVAKGMPRDQITVSFGTGEVTGVFVEDIVCVESSALPETPAVDGEEEQAKASEADQSLAKQLTELAGELKGEMAGDRETGSEDLAPGCFKLRVVLATEMSEDPFKDFHFDGVLGLGLPELSQAYEFNFPGMMSHLVEKLGSPAPHVFAVFLAKHEGESSEISIGGHARSRQAGPMHWSPVIHAEHGHWMLGIKNIYVDGEAVEFCRDGNCRAVADTGTSLLAVPSGAFPEIYEMLRHNAPLHGFCDGDGPSLQFELEGENVTVSMRPEDYASLEPITKRDNKTRDWFKRFFYAKGWPLVKEPTDNFRRDMYCKPLLMSMDLPAPVGPKLFILGEPLLRRYYTMYDTRNLRIGWAQAKHTEPVEPAVDEDDGDWDDDDEEHEMPVEEAE